MHYEISRGVKFGKNLTTAQRASSKFAEEPVVLGKVLRRGYPPIRISEEQYEANLTQLKTLEKAGAITIRSLGVAETTSASAPAVEVKEELPQDSAAVAAPAVVDDTPVEQAADTTTPPLPVAEEVVGEVVEKKSKKRKE